MPGAPRSIAATVAADYAGKEVLLVDVDGTVLDSESTHLQSWEEAYAAHGQVLDREAWLLAVGGRSSVIIYSLLRAVALCEIETGARSLTALSFVDEELVGVDFPEDGVPQTILLS